MANRAYVMSSGKKHKKGGKNKRLREMSIRPTANKGFVVTHSHQDDDGPMYGDDEQYAMDNAQDMHDHVAKHFPASKK